MHLIDATSENVAKEYKTIRKELELYERNLINKPEVVALNKIDSLTPKEIDKKIKSIQKITNSPIFAISAIANMNTLDCLRKISSFVPLKNSKQDVETPIIEDEAPTKKTWSPLD